MRNINICLVFVILLFTACQPNNDVIDNQVYFTDSQKDIIKKVTLDDTGAKSFISSRLAKSTSSELKVHYTINEDILNDYNARNGTAYKLLPSSFYTLPSETVIKAGNVSADPVELLVKPLGASVAVYDKFAIPLEIQQVEGGVDILKPSAKLIVVLDQVVTTSVPYFSGATLGFVYQPESMAEGITAWTWEANVNLDAYNRNNVALWSIYGPNNKPIIYSRFGDLTCDLNQFQGKVSGTGKLESITRFSPKKWYHIAMTYDGTNIRFYIDGVLDFITPHSTPGETFTLMKFVFGHNASAPVNGYANELRFWTVCRSQGEIANNMYVVAPDTEGLFIYWKCDEGSGKNVKDHSFNKWDVAFKVDPKWKQQRFPEKK